MHHHRKRSPGTWDCKRYSFSSIVFNSHDDQQSLNNVYDNHSSVMINNIGICHQETQKAMEAPVLRCIDFSVHINLFRFMLRQYLELYRTIILEVIHNFLFVVLLPSHSMVGCWPTFPELAQGPTIAHGIAVIRSAAAQVPWHGDCGWHRSTVLKIYTCIDDMIYDINCWFYIGMYNGRTNKFSGWNTKAHCNTIPAIYWSQDTGLVDAEVSPSDLQCQTDQKSTANQFGSFGESINLTYIFQGIHSHDHWPTLFLSHGWIRAGHMRLCTLFIWTCIWATKQDRFKRGGHTRPLHHRAFRRILRPIHALFVGAFLPHEPRNSQFWDQAPCLIRLKNSGSILSVSKNKGSTLWQCWNHFPICYHELASHATVEIIAHSGSPRVFKTDPFLTHVCTSPFDLKIWWVFIYFYPK